MVHQTRLTSYMIGSTEPSFNEISTNGLTPASHPTNKKSAPKRKAKSVTRRVIKSAKRVNRTKRNDTGRAVVSELINDLLDGVFETANKNRETTPVTNDPLDISLSELLASSPSQTQTSNTEPDDISDLQLKCERQFSECISLRAQVDLLYDENEQQKKIRKSQQSEIKRLKNDNENLRRQLSKVSGMRRYTEPQPIEIPDNREEIELLNAKLEYLKDHIKSASNTLLNIIEPENNATIQSQVHSKTQNQQGLNVPAPSSSNQLRPEVLVNSTSEINPPPCHLTITISFVPKYSSSVVR